MPEPSKPSRTPLTPEEEAALGAELEAALDNAVGPEETLPRRPRPSRKRRGPFAPAFSLDPFDLAARLSASAAVVWVLIWRQTC